MERERIVFRKWSNTPWYSCFDGPRNIRELAQYLKLSDFYDSLYSPWSALVHGTDIFSNRLDHDGKGGTLIVQIRFPLDAQAVTAIAFNMSIDYFGSFTEGLLPEQMEPFKSWFDSVRLFGQE